MLAAKISLIVSIDMMGLRSEVSFQLLVDAGDMILLPIVDSSDEEKKVLPIDLLITVTWCYDTGEPSNHDVLGTLDHNDRCQIHIYDIV